jgi:hypothetical protein
MKHVLRLVFCFASMALASSFSFAQEVAADKNPAKPTGSKVVLPQGVTEEMLAPPPVPNFMLKKPSTPLTLDDMMQQAREAEKKARQQRSAVANPPAAQAKSPVN